MKTKIKRNKTSDDILIDDAFNQFYEAKAASNLSEKTLHNYKQSFDFWKKVNQFNEDSTCNEIAESTIYRFINYKKNADCSPNSINHYIRDIRTVLYWMMDRDYCPKFKINCIEAQDEGIKFFDDEDVEKLLEKPRKTDSFADWRTYTIICFILATGARPLTILNVKLEDLNFTRKEIHYAHTKAKNAMTIPISNSLEIALKEYIKMWDPSTYLFPNVGDEKLTSNALRLAFERYCNSRDIQQTNMYGLRHTFARNYILSGGSEIKLMNILGHTSLEMTKRYVKLFGQDLKKDYDDFSLLDQKAKAKSRKNVMTKK